MLVKERANFWPLLICVFTTASIPIWPAFISVAGVTPPGISLVPAPWAAAIFGLCSLATFFAAGLLLRERASPPPLFWPIGAYVLSWLVASFLGFDPFTGLCVTWALVMGTAFHAAIDAWYGRVEFRRALFATFLLTGTLVSLLALLMVALRRPALLYAMVHGRATATFIVPGELAGYLLLLIPTALGVALVARSPALRALGIAGVLCASAALVATYSRAGWLGAAVGALFFAWMHAREGRRNVFLVAAGTALGICAGVVMLFHGHHNPSEDFVRLAIWQSGFRAVELFPLTGTGPAAFRHVYPFLRLVGSEPTAFHLHNVPLTAFAETGILGVSALGFLWWRFICLMRAALREASAQNRTLALAITTGLVATWAQGMLDFVQVLVLGCWLPFMALALAAAKQGMEP